MPPCPTQPILPPCPSQSQHPSAPPAFLPFLIRRPPTANGLQVPWFTPRLGPQTPRLPVIRVRLGQSAKQVPLLPLLPVLLCSPFSSSPYCQAQNWRLHRFGFPSLLLSCPFTAGCLARLPSFQACVLPTPHASIGPQPTPSPNRRPHGFQPTGAPYGVQKGLDWPPNGP